MNTCPYRNRFPTAGQIAAAYRNGSNWQIAAVDNHLLSPGMATNPPFLAGGCDHLV
ncbi:hypothetical protein GCM10007291_48700 [Gemmobacter nanjingensis]|uniref:Uncharacterized protein n=1 Tax=Gemmobacter nanjingensis TaxID=488454 RepID=A0ABQ3FUU9_9RHOB|nr:hypothetical protein GCM10007291_48700 [Gemmobacter nanjingensis]